MRLGIDATSVAPEGKGISRVQRGTVEALRALGRHELVVFARHPEAVGGDAVRVSPRLTLGWEQRGLPRAVREHGLDWMLTWTERLPFAGGGRYAVWLFEPPTHRIRQNRLVGASAYQRGSDLVTRAIWKRSLRRAALVLTGSRATAEAIPVPARPLYPGIDEEFRPGGSSREGAYVFAILTSDPRDDPATVLEAFAAVRGRSDALRLLVAGGYRGEPHEGVEYLGRVSDEELVDLYRGAKAYVDASLYEGFGFQVLEAMACGTAVVATAVTSIPELVGDAALLVPPGSPDRLAEEIARAVDPAVREGLVERGLFRAAEFTWERTARELAEALDEAAA